MRLLAASSRTYLPHRRDGANGSLDALLQELGSQVVAEVVCGEERPSRWTRARRWFSPDEVPYEESQVNGYPVYRAHRRRFLEVVTSRLRLFRPDLVLTQLNEAEDVARLALAAGCPTLFFVRDAEFKFFRDRSVYAHDRLRIIANSEFIQDRVRQKLGLEAELLYPMVKPERYVAPARAPRYITLVNPVPKKGLEIVLGAAACLPEHEFLLQEAWPLEPREKADLLKRMAALPNVTLCPPTRDMKGIYARTRLLLAPSQWQEAFGRVVLEAQHNGIPVVASDIGGIPEIVPDRTLLLAPSAPVEAWVQRIREALDERAYGALSEAALRAAQRDRFVPAEIAGKFMRIGRALLQRA